jgi:hypothetical protein
MNTETPLDHGRLNATLGATLAALVKYAPTAEETRAHIRARLGQCVPDELTAYESVAQWILSVAPPPPPAQPSYRSSYRSSFAWDVEFEGEERGTSYYTRSISATQSIELSDDELLECADASDSFDEFVDKVRARLEEAAEEVWPDNVDYGDCDYGDDESSGHDWDEHNVSGSLSAFKATLRSLIETNPEFTPAGEREEQED